MVRTQNKLRLNRSGFTLIELLIVVAIIGVLSTIGVPTFRRMVQKSKKSEAKVSLGGLYTAEQAFYSEYGGYGNVLANVGYDSDGSSNIYVVGFPNNDCSTFAPGADLPAAGDKTIGTNLQSIYPAYYNANQGSMIKASYALNICNELAAGNATLTLNLTTSTNPIVNVFNNSGIDDAFIATASGVISPSVVPTNPGAGVTDVWAINSLRAIANVQDGVK